MEYPALENKLKTLPQAAIDEIADYIDYIFYKFTTPEKQNHTVSKKKGFGRLKDIPFSFKKEDTYYSPKDSIQPQLDVCPSFKSPLYTSQIFPQSH